MELMYKLSGGRGTGHHRAWALSALSLLGAAFIHKDKAHHLFLNLKGMRREEDVRDEHVNHLQFFRPITEGKTFWIKWETCCPRMPVYIVLPNGEYKFMQYDKIGWRTDFKYLEFEISSKQTPIPALRLRDNFPREPQAQEKSLIFCKRNDNIGLSFKFDITKIGKFI